MKIEHIILQHLISNENYSRKVLPYLKEEYFRNGADRHIFSIIKNFITKYNSSPSIDALLLLVDDCGNMSDTDYTTAREFLKNLDLPPKKVSEEWILEQTEKFCQDIAIHNAIVESIDILDGKSKTKTKDSLPDILKDALAVSFDQHIGHDILENYEERYEYYHKKEEKIPFDLEMFNSITNGGVARKTLNIIMAGPNVGKSLCMCHMASFNLKDGKNVLYITLEMAEEKIAQRIDANILDIMLNDLETLPKDVYEKKIKRFQRQTPGKLIVKEFPTAAAHVGHFRHLLNELRLKKDFVPDVIYIDYLNICCSSRVKQGGSINSYMLVKAIAEEIRGLAQEYNVPIWSATQINREGYSSSDPGLENTSESFGLPATADLQVAIITNDVLKQLNQYMIKQLKNRYNDVTQNERFIVGVDRARMKLYDVDPSEQNLSKDTPVMDNTNFGERANEDDSMKYMTRRAGRKNFGELKT